MNSNLKQKSSSSLKINKISEYGFTRKRLISTVGYRSVIFFTLKNTENVYFEVQITTDGFARIGIATEYAEINGPIGIDSHGYSLGTKNGYLFHEGKRNLYANRLRTNSIISCLFIKDIKTLIYFVNGQKIGHEITNIKDGRYWPAISSFKNTNVDVYYKKNTLTFYEKIIREYNLEL